MMFLGERNMVKGKQKIPLQLDKDGVAIALDPSEIANLDDETIKAKYDAHLAEKQCQHCCWWNPS